MSGSVQAIIGNPVQVKPTDPLQTMQGYMGLMNAMQQNANMKQQLKNEQLSNQVTTSQFNFDTATRHAQHFASVASAPDSEVPGLASRLLDQEVSSGAAIPPAEEQRLRGLISQAQAGDTGALGQLRQTAVNGLVGNLSAAQQLASMAPTVRNQDVGGQLLTQVTPSAVAQIQNPAAANTFNVGGLNKTLSPGYESAGDRLIPVGGANGQPVIGLGVSPEQANQIQTLVDPVTGQQTVGRNYQFGGLPQSAVMGVPPGGQAMPAPVNGMGGQAMPVQGNPNAATPIQQPPQGGYRLPGGGVQTPQNNGTVGAGGQAPGGMLNNGPVSINQQAVQAKTDTYGDFRQLQTNQIPLKTDETNMLTAANLLRTVPTGPGVDKVQAIRNYLSSVNAVLGGKLNANDIAAGNYDELQKDLNKIAAAGGSTAKFAGSVEAAMHGNPNMMLNRLANQDVMAQMIGQNRQQQLSYAMTKDKVSGQDFQQARTQATNLDQRALGLDAMSPTAVRNYIAELQKSPNKDALNNFYRTVALAKQHGLYKLPSQSSEQAPQAPAPAAPTGP